MNALSQLSENDRSNWINPQVSAKSQELVARFLLATDFCQAEESVFNVAYSQLEDELFGEWSDAECEEAQAALDYLFAPIVD